MYVSTQALKKQLSRSKKWLLSELKLIFTGGLISGHNITIWLTNTICVGKFCFKLTKNYKNAFKKIQSMMVQFVSIFGKKLEKN